MKLTDIQIDRFGVWQNLSLSLGSGNVHLFYGPNEAGKTTLMRFLRGVLYGFDATANETSAGRPREVAWSGALGVLHQGTKCEIRRTAARGTRGTVRITGLDRKDPADRILAEILSKTDEKVFQYVLSVGLAEIQELATLHDDEVARHLYGTTLGPTGQRLLDITARHERESSRLLDRTTGAGELADWIETSLDIAGEIESLKLLRHEHAELCAEHASIEETINELKSRKAELEHLLRGHLFLERVWSPWNELREYEEELARIPQVTEFPDKGIPRLDAIESELDALVAKHNAIVDAADELRRKSEAIAVPQAITEHSATMQDLIDQRGWFEESLAAGQSADERTGELEYDLNEKLCELGADWSPERLEAIDRSPSAQHALVTAAASYRSALARRARFRKRLKKFSNTNHQKLDELTSKLKELGCQSTEQVLAAGRKNLERYEELGALSSREEFLSWRAAGIAEQIARHEQQPVVPKWFPLFLAVLGLAGAAIAILGLRYSHTTNAVAGASFAFLGLTGLGIVWGFRKQFGYDGGDVANRLSDEAAANERELTLLRNRIAALQSSSEAPAEHSELIRAAVRQIAELERLAALEERLIGQRRRLSELRMRFPNVQRAVDVKRQQWCEVLKRLGLEESLHINSVFELWQKVLEADALHRELKLSRAESTRRLHDSQAFRGRIETLGQRLGRDDDYADPLGVLDAWTRALDALAGCRDEIEGLHSEEAERRAEAADLQLRIDELRSERSLLLSQGGAADREDFERRSAWFAQRNEIQELIGIARDELAEAGRTEPDLALVEEDLVAYDAEQNAERIRTIRIELEEVEQSMHGAFERVGRLKQSIESLEDDARPSQLRFEKSRADAQMRTAAEEWFAAQIAGRALEQARRNYERNCQPAVLAAASRYLERLTRGRYRNVWSPLDRRDLRVDDDHGLSFRVEELSGGTREQLFLAVRLALVRDLSRQGIELPMFLDDILVNFDQLRTEAAVQTLLEFAEEGPQQILFFTCHLHLAHMFESRGVEPTWLPGHHLPIEERRAG